MPIVPAHARLTRANAMTPCVRTHVQVPTRNDSGFCGHRGISTCNQPLVRLSSENVGFGLLSDDVHRSRELCQKTCEEMDRATDNGSA